MPALRTRSDDRLIEPDVQALSCAARSFTGDFYYYQQGGGLLRFVVGDVSGKGLAAAVLMAMIQEQIETSFASGEDILAAVRSLHRMLLPETGGRRFASLVIGELSARGELRLVNAGHCLPILRRADGEVEMLPPTGPVIGLIDFADWTAFETLLRPGDALLLYSDGITEAENPDGEELGTAVLARAVSSEAPVARVLTGRVFDLVRAHRRGALLEDDSTVMAIVATPAPAGWKGEPTLSRKPLAH